MAGLPEERVAFVTGGANGIGRALCHKLGSRGISVVVVDIDAEAGIKVAEHVANQWNVRSKFVQCDVSKETQVLAAIASALEWTGRIDYGANCAGIIEKIWDEEESITTEMYERINDVNAKGVWLCQKHLALQMKKQERRPVNCYPAPQHAIEGQRGAIANTISLGAYQAAGLAAYTASKHAVVGITKNGAKFYGPHGIRCNGTCPGWTFTNMLERSLGAAGTFGTDECNNSPLRQMTGLRRFCFPEEQANLISFLLSDESSYLNAAVITADGGHLDIRWP